MSGAQRLSTWIGSLGNAGAISNAGALAVERRHEDYVIRALRRSLRTSMRGRAPEPEQAATARSA